MKALSVRAPWWWFILYAGKDIENRDWYTYPRGTVLLHASKWFSAEDVRWDWDVVKRTIHPSFGDSAVTLRMLKDNGGHIVGTVDIVGCVTHSDSPWFSGKHGFVLKNPVAFKTPIPCKGALGFFDVPDALIQERK